MSQQKWRDIISLQKQISIVFHIYLPKKGRLKSRFFFYPKFVSVLTGRDFFIA